ncbi:MAG: roadblock/LC7 domain-containing protein [Candidatus Heimdallarchaeaceae archaeon]
MSISGREMEKLLQEFSDNTEGVLGCSIILAKDALMLAEISQKYDSMVIQWLSERILSMAKESLKQLMNDYQLQSVTIEEENHLIFLRPVGTEYYLVFILNKEENRGLIEYNIKRLQEKFSKALGIQE